MTGRLTPQEIAQFVSASNKMEFPIPPEAFFAWSRNFYVNAVELAIMRTVDGKKEIFLGLRSPNDPHYGNMWAMPGAVCLPGKTFAEMVSSCIAKETAGTLPEARIPEDFVKHWDNTDEIRGHTNQFLYIIDLELDEASTLKGGQFFPLDNLPTPLVKSHVRMTNWLRDYLNK